MPSGAVCVSRARALEHSSALHEALLQRCTASRRTSIHAYMHAYWHVYVTHFYVCYIFDLILLHQRRGNPHESGVSFFSRTGEELGLVQEPRDGALQ